MSKEIIIFFDVACSYVASHFGGNFCYMMQTFKPRFVGLLQLMQCDVLMFIVSDLGYKLSSMEGITS